MQSLHIKKTPISIISRNEIPTIKQIEIVGQIHYLGILKDFRKQSFLASFIPEEARLSISWVSLKPDEVLSVHDHPTSSMIIICEGEGEITGDCSQFLKTGDIAAIPPYNTHGFVGRGENGFWGLSIQFEGLGLYEKRDNPRVHFLKRDNPAQKLELYSDQEFDQNIINSTMRIQKPDEVEDFNSLLNDQNHYRTLYHNNNLLKILESTILQDSKVKDRLLEVLNQWADWFQRIIFARAAIRRNSNFQRIAEEHIIEEVGHNHNLFAVRDHKPITFWDPFLEAGASWFFKKMLFGSDAERAILVHFVLEGSGEIFHREAAKVFPDIDHFSTHGEEEEEHFNMGCQLLQKTPDLDIKGLRNTLLQGWNMMEIICNRMAHLATSQKKDNF